MASKARPSRRIPIVVLGLVLLVVAGGAVVYFRPVAVFRAFQSAQLRLAGVESHEVTLGGHRIHYRVRGAKSGKPIVMVHGLAGSTEDWINLSPYLDRAGYRVYMIDLLGFGQSEQPPNARYSISEQAALVASFLDAMQIRQTDLAGWSMGGWTVQRVAIEHPERVRRIALIDSAGLLILPDWDTRLFTPATPQQLDQLDALLMPRPPTVPGFVARDIIRESNRNAWVVHRALASMLSARDVTDAQLPTLQMPVLLLWGDQDRITPISEGRSMHRLIAQSRLEIATGCGHMAPEQCAAVYGPELVRFLQAEPSLGPEEGVLKLPNEMYIAR